MGRDYLLYHKHEYYFLCPLQVPLEGFKALQGVSGAQKFQIHKAYGAPKRLPSAHTWYVVARISHLDMPILVAVHMPFASGNFSMDLFIPFCVTVCPAAPYRDCFKQF
jgi:hypothetical protein